MTRVFQLLARVALVVFCLLTWAYGAASYSPFAFDMFIRPRLMPSLASFVAWHHLWYWGPYLLTVVSLWTELRPGSATSRSAFRLSLAFTVVFGAIGLRLLTTPYLPTLGNDVRSLGAALAALAPLIWIAAIDHAVAWPAVAAAPSRGAGATGQHRLLVVCSSTAGYAALLQLSLSPRRLEEAAALEWLAGSLWVVVLCAATFTVVYLLLSLTAGLASAARAPRAWEHALAVLLLSAGVGEFVRRVVLRAVAFDEAAAIPVSLLTGAALGLVWSGVMLRRAAAIDLDGRTGLDLLFAPRRRRAASVVGLLALPLLVGVSVQQADRLDWDFVIQKTVMVAAWAAAFALFVGASPAVRERAWSVRELAVPPLAVLAALYAFPWGMALITSATGGNSHVESALEPSGARDAAMRLQAAAFVREPGLDRGYYRYLQQTAASSIGGSPSPRVEFSKGPRHAAPRPHVFVIVIDSLRRDYVSLYNPRVDFTPELDRFGRDNFVFSNAFTRYGGTWLSMPSLWVGGPVARGWGGAAFDRVNSLEQLIDADGYRLVINDYTVSGYLRKETPATFLEPDVPSADTDLCRLLDDLETHLDGTAGDGRPVFTYLAPMNVHLANTRSGKVLSEGEQYPGFYAPYASRLRRADGCFGRFVGYLKERGLYEDSVIVLTSDHGDSLGENGQWGHQFGLFPEHVRVPLIVHLPERMRSAVTTDLGRVTFLTDIAPTMYGLLGHDVEDLGPLFGAPLFVPRDGEPRPRRRDSFVLMSSYGPTYGLIRRNGRFLYVSDVAEGRDFAFDLSRGPLGAPMAVSDDLRRVSRQLIREQVEAVNAFYGIEPAP